MAKKKKPAGNPARGFATTSIASKPKQENPVEKQLATRDAQTSLKEAAVAPQASVEIRSADTKSIAKIAYTPEEIEAQLEHDALQLLVEKYAAKTRREVQRQNLKFQTDRRLLRAQSQSACIHEWLPRDIIDEVLSLARTEYEDAHRKQGQRPFFKVLSEEDAISKLWILDLLLLDLNFSHDPIHLALQWLCANIASVDFSASVWGLQECLEWLILNDSEDKAASFEQIDRKSASNNPLKTSHQMTPTSEITISERMLPKGVDDKQSGAVAPHSNTENPNHIVGDVSDIDSDLEPEALVPIYLEKRARLYEIDPNLDVLTLQKQTNKARIRRAQQQETPVVRKLLSQMQQLSSDTLFDQQEAERLWPTKRNRIAKEKAAKRQEHQASTFPNKDSSLVVLATEKPAEVIKSSVSDSASDDEGDLFKEMFASVLDQADVKEGVRGEPASTIVLRDFGETIGLTPRKLLEEAVHSRDPNARLVYKMISPTAYSCRHQLTVSWSQRNDFDCDTDVKGVVCSTEHQSTSFQSIAVATVSKEQSIDFMATAALFSICREEKSYLRLPPVWRDLYREFLDHRQSRIDEHDRDTVKIYRAMIRDQIEDEDSNGVVLTNRFKTRNLASISPSASRSEHEVILPSQAEFLKEIWTRKMSTPSYQRMLVGRVSLPVFTFQETILATIDKNQVTIICGETGCGKSTQIPSYILQHELSVGKSCKIFCTEPRRISAISLSQRVSAELGEVSKDLGTSRSLVGYAIRLESKTCSQTRLIYVTVGVVLRMLESSRGLDDVTHLIVDEVHERSIDTDFLLIMLRSLLIKRPTLKVVLMSATVDAARFSNYFSNAPILNIPGRTFPVQRRYLEDAIELTGYVTTSDKPKNSEEDEEGTRDKGGILLNLPGYSVTTIKTLCGFDEYAIDFSLIVRLLESVAYDVQLRRFSSAVLVFLPGLAEIRQLNDMLVGHPSFEANWLIYPLHSTISNEDQQAAFLIPAPGMRKIVLATNIAETGVTIPDVTCVIDTGKHKEMRFDERRQLSRLTQSFISRANAKQRCGRAGRVQEGLCFHLFTRYRHDQLMADQQTPEMLRLSLQDLVMRTKICDVGDIEATLSSALDPPSSRNIRRAIDALVETDALTSSEDLTSLGRQIAKLPLDAHLGKLLLIASMYGCVDAAITMAAILSSKSVFVTPFGAKQRADSARNAFKRGDSDILTDYNAYKAWKIVCTTVGQSEAQFCHRNFLSPQNLSNVEDTKAQLLSALVQADFIQLTTDERYALHRYRNSSRCRSFVQVPEQYSLQSDNDVLVNSIIAAAFYPKLMIREGKGWRNISNNQVVGLAPTSVNKGSTKPMFLSYYHMMQSSSKFYNAHSTSIAYPIPMLLMIGADMDFKLHAGVISLPGNTIRFAVQEWRHIVALKILRRRVKEMHTNKWKSPSKQLCTRENQWLRLLLKIFDQKFEKDERLREQG